MHCFTIRRDVCFRGLKVQPPDCFCSTTFLQVGSIDQTGQEVRVSVDPCAQAEEAFESGWILDNLVPGSTGMLLTEPASSTDGLIHIDGVQHQLFATSFTEKVRGGKVVRTPNPIGDAAGIEVLYSEAAGSLVRVAQNASFRIQNVECAPTDAWTFLSLRFDGRRIHWF